jgi:hypothetical protein
MRTKLSGAWRAATLGLVALVALVNLIFTAQTTPPPAVASPAGPSDPTLRQERRFARIRAAIRDRGLKGTLGYVGNVPPSQLRADAGAVEAYYRAQFALAPVVLDPAAEREEWMVADLTPANPGWKAPRGWRVEQDFGDGVKLLRKEAP